MNLTQATGNIDAQIMLCKYWHNSAAPKPVWAVFTDTRGMVSWSTNKRAARKVGGRLNEFYWLAKVQA
jgi:hypothetical protein